MYNEWTELVDHRLGCEIKDHMSDLDLKEILEGFGLVWH